MRKLVRSVLATALVVLVPHGDVIAAPCWRPPVTAPITDHFREPACSWCPGNRGVEYGTAAGARVTAAGTGRVTFAGPVAGAVYVVVRHADGRRVTYGNLRPTRWSAGDPVIRGTLVGRTAGPLHLGVREGDRYVDPEPFIGRLVRRAWLVPLDGTEASGPPPAVLRCDRRA